MDIESLKQITNLAKLKIEDSEIENTLSDFNKVLSYVEKIKELDTSSIGEDEIYFNHENSIRPDVLNAILKTEDLGKIAPKFENGYVVVPRVIET